MKTFLKSIVILFILSSTFLLNPAFAKKEASQSANAKNEPELPMNDIKRFVTAIAVIKHYYIKKMGDQELFSDAIGGMVTDLDPHSSYLDPDALKDLKISTSGQFGGVGIEIMPDKGMLKVISPLDGTPAEKAGIKPGDMIIKIDDKIVRDMSLNDAVKMIRGKKGSIVSLTILRESEKNPLVFKLKRDAIKIKTVSTKLLENHYGYARIAFFQGPLKKQLTNAIKKLKKEAGGKLNGLVLDLRNNPGGVLESSTDVANMFLTSKDLKKYNKVLVYTKGRTKDSDLSIKASGTDTIKGVPMVVLINKGSASASEIVAGALQDYKRAIIMGTRSFGKGSVQTILPIGKDSAIKLTTALYYTPSGKVIQARGIQPDIYVPKLTISLDKNSALLEVDEDDLQDHITNHTKEDKKQAELFKKQKQDEIKLAEKDYQLYEALLVLKGLHTVGQH